jgi:hypothetical protein
MRCALVASVAVAVAFASAASSAPTKHLLRANGLTVVAPTSWHLTREQLTECSSPRQVLAVTDTRRSLGLRARLARARTLVLFLEDAGYRGSNFPPRKRFRLQPLGMMGGCCEMPISRGFEVFFRDHGRNLYAFVYAAKRANAAKAVAMLNTLVVEPR